MYNIPNKKILNSWVISSSYPRMFILVSETCWRRKMNLFWPCLPKKKKKRLCSFFNKFCIHEKRKRTGKVTFMRIILIVPHIPETDTFMMLIVFTSEKSESIQMQSFKRFFTFFRSILLGNKIIICLGQNFQIKKIS